MFNIHRRNYVLQFLFMVLLKIFMKPIGKTTLCVVLLCFLSNNLRRVSCNSDGVTLPTRCETCKYMSYELEQRFAETGKTNEVLRTGSPLMGKEKTTKYRQSELRLIETLEGVCERILQYNMHKEHENSLRFAKGQSVTMQTLHGLVDKGVKVELGIPYDLWDSPSVEVTTMKSHCEYILEMYENEIERWYFDQDENKPSLKKYLCEDRVLKTTKDRACLKDQDDKKKGDVGSDGSKTNKQSSVAEKTDRKSAPVDSLAENSKPTVDKVKKPRKTKKGDDEL